MNNIVFGKVTLDNFKCHSHIEVDFSENQLILLTGRNGQGKSSIIDAMYYALYDETTKGLKGDSVIQKKVGKNCSVLFEFKINDDNYRIENYRKHKVHGNDKYLYKNGKNISGATVKDTNVLIENLILHKDVFINCILFSQYIKKSFTELTHSGRKDILDEILSLSKYQYYYDAFSNEIKSIENEKDKLNNDIIKYTTSISIKNEQIQNEKNALSETKQNKQNYKNKLTDELYELNNTYKDLTFEFECFKDFYSTFDDVKSKVLKTISENEENIKSNKSKSMSDIQNENNKYKMLKSEIESKFNLSKSNIKDKYQKIVTLINDKLSEIKIKNEKELNVLNMSKHSELDEINKDYESKKLDIINIQHSYENDINKLKSLQAVNSSKINDLKNKMNQFTIVDGNCPMCGQKLTSDELKNDIAKHKTDAEKEINKLNKEIEKIDTQINEVNKNIFKNNENLDSLNALQSKERNSINEKYNNECVEYSKKHENNITILNDKKSDVINKCDNEIQELNSDKINKINALDIECAATISKIDDTYKNLALNDIKELKLHKQEYEDLNSKYTKVSNLKSKIDMCNNEIENKNNMIKLTEDNMIEIVNKHSTNISTYKTELNSLITSMNVISDKLKKFDDVIEKLKFWKIAFGDTGIKSILLDESIPILNKKAIELNQLVDTVRVRFNSQKTLKSGDLSNKFDVEVIQTKNLSEYSELSAGETRLSNIIILLCLRNLLENLNGVKLNLLLLDEILDSLDEENSMIVVDMIKELSKEYSILLISHTHKNWISPTTHIML